MPLSVTDRQTDRREATHPAVLALIQRRGVVTVRRRRRRLSYVAQVSFLQRRNHHRHRSGLASYSNKRQPNDSGPTTA